MSQDATQIGPSRHQLRLDEYDAPRTPDDGAPDRTRTVTVWQEPDGTPITDQGRIAGLETRITQKASM